MFNLDEIVQLAREVEDVDLIDWNNLNISKEHAYKLIASGLLDLIENVSENQDQIKILLATATKLSVENFVLNLKLLTKDAN